MEPVLVVGGEQKIAGLCWKMTYLKNDCSYKKNPYVLSKCNDNIHLFLGRRHAC